MRDDSDVDAVLVRLGDSEIGTLHLGNRVVVGRLDSSDLALDDASVSREHARLLRQGPSYIVEDLGSTNGTLVNGKRIDTGVALNPGDVVTFGSVEFRYEQNMAFQEQDSETQAIFQNPGIQHELDVPPSPASSSPLGSLVEIRDDDMALEGQEQERSAVGASEIGDEPLTPLAPERAAEDYPLMQASGVVEEAKATVEKLNDLIDDLAGQVRRGLTARAEMQEQVLSLQEAGQLRESLRALLQGMPASSMDNTQIAALEHSLQFLQQNPRDVEILMVLARQVEDLMAVINEFEQLRALMDRLKREIGMPPTQQPSVS